MSAGLQPSARDAGAMARLPGPGRRLEQLHQLGAVRRRLHELGGRLRKAGGHVQHPAGEGAVASLRQRRVPGDRDQVPLHVYVKG